MKRTTQRTIGVLLVVLGVLLAAWGILAMTGVNPAESASISIIGGADGPTAIYVTGTAGPLGILLLLCCMGILPLALGAVCLVLGVWLLLRRR